MQQQGKGGISVIIVNFNGGANLKKTLDSVLALEHPNYEVIVVDNGSSDDSIAITTSYGSKVRLLQSPRYREKNFAVNFAVPYANFDHLLLLDNDVVLVNRNLLNELGFLYDDRPNTGCLTLAFVNIGENTTKGYGNYLSRHFTVNTPAVPPSSLASVNGQEIGHPSGIGIFIRKDVWNKVGGYDDFLKFGGDDNDLGIRLWNMGLENRLYSASVQIHTGMAVRNDKKKYALKFMEMVYGHLYVITKTYSNKNAFISVLCYGAYAFLKSLKQTVTKRNPYLPLSIMGAYLLYIKNLPHAMKMRALEQGKRVILTDRFLEIRPPKFYV